MADEKCPHLQLDGIHVGFLEDPSGAEKKMNVLNLAPFVKAAEMAAHDQILFTITHSEIDPGDYAGTNLTARTMAMASTI